jgi:hypothetical protein
MDYMHNCYWNRTISHQIRTLEFFVKYLKLKATWIQFGETRGQNEKLGCTCLGVCKLKCLVLNITTSLFLHPNGLNVSHVKYFFNVMKRDSILWFLYNLIWYKIETIWNQKFYSKWGIFNCKQVAMWQSLWIMEMDSL